MVVSLFMIAVFRFLLPFPLLELAGWVLFLGLEGAGQLGLGGGALYETRAWRALLAVWEALVYNPLVDLERHWLLVVASLSCLWGAWMAYRTAGLRDLLTRRRLMYRRVKRAHARGGQRDLDV